MRTIIFHYHIFKNAGTSLDAAFKKVFKESEGQWLTKEFVGQPQQNREQVRKWIVDNPQGICFSSHSAQLPPPKIEGVRIIPVLFFRHPIDRIYSAYTFERKQNKDSFGSVLARNTDFKGYVEVQLVPPSTWQCVNMQTRRLSHMVPAKEGDELARAQKALAELPFVGVVEEYERSIKELQKYLRANGFAELVLHSVKKNVTNTKGLSLTKKLQHIEQLLGHVTYARLQMNNGNDLLLHKRLSGRSEKKRTKILLHIGRQTTGTVSLQFFLKNNQKYLLKNDFHYVVTEKYGGAHHTYAEYLAEFTGSQRLWQEKVSEIKAFFRPLFERLSESKVNIISSESFQNCDPDLVREIFSEYDCSVVCYLRSELEQVASSYAQRIQATEYSGTIEQYAEAFVRNIDYVSFLISWEQAFPGKLRVRLYEKNAFAQVGGIIGDFCTFCLNLQVTNEMQNATPHNPSLSQQLVEVKRQANARLGRKIVSSKVYGYFTQLAEQEGVQSYRLPPSIKEMFVRRYGKEQKQWAMPYFGVESVFDYGAYQTAEPGIVSGKLLDMHIKKICEIVGVSTDFVAQDRSGEISEITKNRLKSALNKKIE